MQFKNYKYEQTTARKIISKGKHHIAFLAQTMQKEEQRHFSKAAKLKKHNETITETSWLELLFLSSMLAAIIIDAREKMKVLPLRKGTAKPQKKYANKLSKKIIKQIVYHYFCNHTSLATFNKPNITLGKYRGWTIPNSCRGVNQALCKSEINILKNFKPNAASLIALRDQASQEFNVWRNEVIALQPEIITSVSQTQLSVYNEIVKVLSELKQFQIYASYMHSWAGGNCWEHTASTLMDLLKYKIKYNLEMKIQTVTLKCSSTQDKIYDHIFLLLDSDGEDVNISDDARAVQEYLGNIAKGKICDAWNHGYYKDIKNDKSGFYNGEAHWDQIKVRSYSLNFANFTEIPKIARGFICNEFAKMGLDVQPKKYCRLFNKRSTTFVNKSGSAHTFHDDTRISPYPS